MCRSIRTLFNFEPPVTDEEIRAASLQFVRKLSGFAAPSKPNQAVFDRSVADVYKVARRLIDWTPGATSPTEEAVAAPQLQQGQMVGGARTRGAARARQHPPRDPPHIRPQHPARPIGEIDERKCRLGRHRHARTRADRVQVGERGLVAGQQQMIAIVDAQPEFAVQIRAAATTGDRSCLHQRDRMSSLAQRHRCRQTSQARPDDMDVHALAGAHCA